MMGTIIQQPIVVDKVDELWTGIYGKTSSLVNQTPSSDTVASKSSKEAGGKGTVTLNSSLSHAVESKVRGVSDVGRDEMTQRTHSHEFLLA